MLSANVEGSLPAPKPTKAMSTRGGSPPPEARYAHGSNQPQSVVAWLVAGVQRVLPFAAPPTAQRHLHSSRRGHHAWAELTAEIRWGADTGGDQDRRGFEGLNPPDARMGALGQ